MRKILLLCLFSITASFVFAFDSAFWSDIQKFPTPNYRWGKTGDAAEGIKAREIFYEGENFKGKPTEVFAYYCTPGILKGDESLDKNLPVIVCLHGGGGRAFNKWVELWAERGYAAIAMDWSGNGAELVHKNLSAEELKKLSRGKRDKRIHLPNGGPDKIPSTVSLADGKAERDAWAYQAVGAIVRAHSLVRSFKEIDPNKTALTGISWGGYLTSLVSGVDGRFKAAVPVYGCGFICEFPERWGADVGEGSPTKARWIELFDPSKSLEVTKIPMLFVNSPTDRWYPLSIWTKSADLARGQTFLDSSLRHGHVAGWTPPEIEAFIASKICGKLPLASFGKIEKVGEGAKAKIFSKTKITEVKLFFTKTDDQPKWEFFKWESVPAEFNGNFVSVKKIPEGARAYYFSATDERGLKSTSNAKIVK